MKTLSLCMIVKNEEDTLPNCLESVNGIFDEIIIVDTGSTDKTREVAAHYTDKIFSYSWNDDFSAARNYSFSKSNCDYLMWLDADDILLEDDAKKLLRLKKDLDGRLTQIAARYDVGFDENGFVTMSYYRERIFLKKAMFVWSGRIHETIPIAHDCMYADFAVTHHKIHPTQAGRNLRIFQKMISDGEVLDARNSFYYARELYYNEKTEEAIVELEKFIHRPDGFIENKIDACLVLADCMRKTGNDPLHALLESFTFSQPRAEICCEIGRYFLEKSKIDEAIFWYEQALSKTPNLKNGAFILCDCYDIIPLLQLCVLYYAKGDEKKAKQFNDKAAAVKPNDAAVLFNNEFFKKNK